MCFTSCAVISFLLHNIGVRFFQMCVFCIYVCSAEFFPISFTLKVWSLFRMCSTSLCIPVVLNVVDVFCVAVCASEQYTGKFKKWYNRTFHMKYPLISFHHVTGRPTGKKEVQVCSVIWLRHVKGLELVKIHHPLVKVHKAQVIVMMMMMMMVKNKQVWIWCSAFSCGRTDVHQQQLGYTGMSTEWPCVMHMLLPERTDTLSWPTLLKN